MKNNSNKTFWTGFTLVCVMMLVFGIWLVTRTEMRGAYPAKGESWKLILGTAIAAIGGFSWIGGLVIHFHNHPPAGGFFDPNEALMTGQMSQERYDSIRRGETIALVLAVLGAAALLWFWKNPASVVLAVCLVFGAIGAKLLAGSGKGAVRVLAVVVGVLAGIVISSLSKPDTSRRYAYFVNGVKVGEGNGAASNFLASWFGAALLCAGLILGIAYLITILCTLAAKK